MDACQLHFDIVSLLRFMPGILVMLQLIFDFVFCSYFHVDCKFRIDESLP